jgi:hypothetical protein
MSRRFTGAAVMDSPAPPASGGEAAGGPRPAPADNLDLKAKMDRFGDILNKTLDLAEIGMNLSLSLITTMSTIAQDKIVQRMTQPMAPADPQEMPQAGAPQATEPRAPPVYGITNRLRLVPGGPATISFSVNNESVSEPKQVTLHVEGYAGDRSGRFLPADMLRVVPASGTIQPMDFEKFVLEGTIPADAVPDTYRGAVVVASDDVIRIPIWLAIDAADAAH